ncbi:potassium channel family protein [Zhaonella formicivorans]|uniref:potassium channel family protein n=1 Tax=Zhaonella formicivorans TaxID=2528593 RepID=UPI0010E1FE56|nr:TrkA family potassium uptake protein [Zhaonella formicivorans]
MRKQFAVIGLGHFGESVAKNLSKKGHEVLAIDSSEAHIQEISEYVTHAVQANALEEETLRALGIRNFDAVIIAIGEDIQASILLAVMLKELGVKYIVAKAQNDLHGKTLSKIGVDKVVYPEREMGERLATQLSSNDILQYLELSDDYSIAEIVVHPKINNQSLGKLNLHAKYGIIVMAVKSGEEIIVAPGADVVVKEGDIMCVMGAKRSIEQLDKAM